MFSKSNSILGWCGGLHTFNMDIFSASTVDPGSKDKMNAPRNFTIFQNESYDFSERWFLDMFERHWYNSMTQLLKSYYEPRLNQQTRSIWIKAFWVPLYSAVTAYAWYYVHSYVAYAWVLYLRCYWLASKGKIRWMGNGDFGKWRLMGKWICFQNFWRAETKMKEWIYLVFIVPCAKPSSAQTLQRSRSLTP